MFEWEESTFLGIKALYQRVVTRPKERRAAQVRAELSAHRQRLFVLAHLIAERPIALFETAERVLCDGDRVFLPPEMSLGSNVESNIQFYDLKALLGGLAIKNRWRPGTIPDAWKSHSPGIAMRFDQLQAQFPEHDLVALLGHIRATVEDNSTQHLLEDGDTFATAQKDEVTEIDGQGQLDLEVELDSGDDGPGADMPLHTFEKAETLEEHTGLSRKSDGEDELEEHEEALREVTMNRVLRSRERPQSIYRGDALFQAAFFEGGNTKTQGIPYPEWDHKRRTLRRNWCFVRETETAPGDPAWVIETEKAYRSLILDLKKKVAHLANQSLRVKRQPLGNEFDLDALVAREVDLRSRRSPDDNLYLDRRRRLHDVAALILLDRSYSTDGYLGGRRVLDLIRETILCVGEVLDIFIEGFAIAAFSSNTRQQCRFDWVKRFDDPWMRTRHRLAALQAEGYTRIGPALRHAHECLFKRQAERRIVILVTDGRPCDYDRYEGIYGIRDVKHAIDQGKRHGITTHAFAVEDRAKEFFPAMFTPDHFSIVPRPRALTASLCDLFVKLRTHA